MQKWTDELIQTTAWSNDPESNDDAQTIHCRHGKNNLCVQWFWDISLCTQLLTSSLHRTWRGQTLPRLPNNRLLQITHLDSTRHETPPPLPMLFCDNSDQCLCLADGLRSGTHQHLPLPYPWTARTTTPTSFPIRWSPNHNHLLQSYWFVHNVRRDTLRYLYLVQWHWHWQATVHRPFIETKDCIDDRQPLSVLPGPTHVHAFRRFIGGGC